MFFTHFYLFNFEHHKQSFNEFELDYMFVLLNEENCFFKIRKMRIEKKIEFLKQTKHKN